MSEMPLLIFLHVPKTAGTSFKQWLTEYYSGNVLFHKNARKKVPRYENDPIDARGIDDRGVANYGQTVCDIHEFFDQRGVTGFDGFDAVAGHISFDFRPFAVLERPVLFCSAVRDPVDRVVSLYNWARVNTHGVLHPSVEGRTLFESLQDKGRFYKESKNKQLNCIFGKKRGFLIAKKRSNMRWTMICKHDRYDLLMQRIAELYGRPVGALPHRNRVRSEYKDDVCSQPDFDEAAALIRKINAEEVAFFESFGDFIELHRPQWASNIIQYS
jgi:hypothetical protein